MIYLTLGGAFHRREIKTATNQFLGLTSVTDGG
jgi:hypothetical protein